CAPFGSMHGADLDGPRTEAWDKAFKEGTRLESEKQYAEAVRRYQEAEKLDGNYAELAFRLGRCYLALGDGAQAKQYFTRARDLDTLRFRTNTTINETTRSVAAAAGARLADAEAGFARESPNGLPGEDLFLEHVHMTFKGNYQLARTLFEVI